MQFPKTKYTLLSLLEPNILLIVINREKQYNALSFAANWELHNVINWAEEEESVWCIIITGSGNKSFCAGMDLVNAHEESGKSFKEIPPSGFGGISNRRMSRKPIIAAVNGFALGGGMEMVSACNIVVATEKSKFGFPEVKQGVVIEAGGLARVTRTLGYQITSELVLTGRFIDVNEAHRYGLVNAIVPNDENVVKAALKFAKQITANSPDAVFLTKQGILHSLENGSVTDATKVWTQSPEANAWKEGENLAEGLKAFAEKRKPQWKNPSKL